MLEEYQEFAGAVGKLNNDLRPGPSREMLELEAYRRPEDPGVRGITRGPLSALQDRDWRGGDGGVIHLEIFVASTGAGTIDQFVADLRSRFKIKDLEEATYHMGCHILRNRQERELKIDQHLHAQTIAELFGIVKISMIRQRGSSHCRRRMGRRPWRRQKRCRNSPTRKQWRCSCGR